MEFYQTVEKPHLDVDALKNLLSIENMPKLCDSIDTVIADEGNEGVIYCLWGEFHINRALLKYGVRFSLPNCPNALAWSITKDDGSDEIVIHCAINKKEHNDDFIETVFQFIDDWKEGLAVV